jgi:hypothetical protein
VNWYHNSATKTGFAIDACKKCKQKRYREGKMNYISRDYFGDFEKQALKDQIRRASQNTVSTDMEIGL